MLDVPARIELKQGVQKPALILLDKFLNLGYDHAVPDRGKYAVGNDYFRRMNEVETHSHSQACVNHLVG
jgi:hypothetical protein